MLRLLSFILALGGLLVSALGIYLMTGNELPTSWLPKTETAVERKTYRQEGGPPLSSTNESPVTPSSPESQQTAESEGFESLEGTPRSLTSEGGAIQVMPTPMKSKTARTITRSNSNGVEETTTDIVHEQKAAFEEPLSHSAPVPKDDEVIVGTSAVESLPSPISPPQRTLEQQLRTVPIAYETPKTAAFNSTFTVTLSLDARENATTAIGGLSGSSNTNVAEADVQVSNRVTANLVGLDQAFEVVPEFSEPQRLSTSTESVWRWKVTPLKSGSQRLEFEIYAIDENDDRQRIVSFKDTVTVEVSRIGQAMFLAQQYNPIVVILAGFGSLLAGIFGVLRFFKS